MKLNKEIFLYLIFGVLTTVVNIITYIFCAKVFHLSYEFSTVIAWFISVIFAFVTNKIFVFSSRDNSLSTIIKETSLFFFYRILSLGLDIGIMFVTIQLIGLQDVLAKVIANIFVVLVNYIVSRFHIFKKD
ncbi:putative flippase GtrA [Priestia megaterium]|uniref:GtrA family protein n=1 Tax=Priestia megaterium TaxID=1404 RepID=UPI0005591E65|nr:GtrA family protein [Priestia megaterium]